MRALITILAIFIHLTGSAQTVSNAKDIIIGKAYVHGENPKSKKLFISVHNDLEHAISEVEVFYNRTSLVIINRINPNEKKSFSFAKKDLSGENVIILKYQNLFDTLKNTDEISYNIHKLEVIRDPIFYFQFDDSSLSLTKNGLDELKVVDSLFKAKYNFEDYEIILSGMSTLGEAGTDKFIGLKRCKTAIDALVDQFGFPRSVFKIKDEIPQDNKRFVGVSYSIVDRRKAPDLTASEEDEYFKATPKDKKNKKQN